MDEVYVPALVIHPNRTADLRYVRVFNQDDRRHWIDSVGPYGDVPPDAPAEYKRIMPLNCKPRDLPTVMRVWRRRVDGNLFAYDAVVRVLTHDEFAAIVVEYAQFRKALIA